MTRYCLMFWSILCLTGAALVFNVRPIFAVAKCDFATEALKNRPDADKGPTTIQVGVFVFDLVGIDTVKEEFTLDFLLQATWEDPRLGKLVRNAGQQVCEVPLEEIWQPAMIMVNRRTLRGELPRELYAHADGAVIVRQRYLGTFSAKLDLTNFPRDTQTLHISFVSLAHTSDELKFEFVSGGGETAFSENGWSASPGRVTTGAYEIDLLRGKDTLDTVHLARADYELEVHRHFRYYIWKVYIPLTLIVIISWTVFWIDPSQLGPQVGIGSGMTLSVVAFLFSLQSLLPQIPYLTRLDLYVYTTLIFVFLAFIEALITCMLASRGKESVARRTDRWCRVIFPVSFIILIWSFHNYNLFGFLK